MTTRRRAAPCLHKEPACSVPDAAYEAAAALFRALGDPGRLRLLACLTGGERCVSELAQAVDDNVPAVSQRLRLLKSERIVKVRRAGKHMYYSLSDQHARELVANGLAHAAE